MAVDCAWSAELGSPDASPGRTSLQFEIHLGRRTRGAPGCFSCAINCKLPRQSSLRSGKFRNPFATWEDQMRRPMTAGAATTCLFGSCTWKLRWPCGVSSHVRSGRSETF